MKYDLTCSLAASELAHRIGAQLSGPDLPVNSVAAISEKAAGALTYWQSDTPLPDGLPSGTCVIVKDLALHHGSKQVCLLVCPNPRLGFVRLLHWLEKEKWLIPPLGGGSSCVSNSAFHRRHRFGCIDWCWVPGGPTGIYHFPVLSGGKRDNRVWLRCRSDGLRV